MNHGALTNLNCANDAHAHHHHDRVSERELLGTIAEAIDAAHFKSSAREVNYFFTTGDANPLPFTEGRRWVVPLTPTPRLNRIPRATAPTSWSAWLSKPLQRWQLRRTIRRLARAIKVLEEHMNIDAAIAESLKREYKTSPTLKASMSADALVMAGLNRDFVAAHLALSDLGGQP
jgi:hypothetical protein